MESNQKDEGKKKIHSLFFPVTWKEAEVELNRL